MPFLCGAMTAEMVNGNVAHERGEVGAETATSLIIGLTAKISDETNEDFLLGIVGFCRREPMELEPSTNDGRIEGDKPMPLGIRGFFCGKNLEEGLWSVWNERSHSFIHFRQRE